MYINGSYSGFTKERMNFNMKFSLFFDVSMCIRPAEGNVNTRKYPALESSYKKENPREGRYFTKPSEEEIQKVLTEGSESIDVESPDEDPIVDTEDPAEEKPIGDEIPLPDLDVKEDSDQEDVSPIEEEAPKEDDDEVYAEESTENADPLHTENVIDDLLQMFTQDDEKEVSVEEDMNFEIIPVDDIPVKESVERETPAIPSILRRVEAEDTESPIPLNVSVEVNKETADRTVDKETYTDKKEETKETKIMNMISKFSSLPLSQKKEYANKIYQTILDTNAKIDLSNYRMIWKLVDHPFIESRSKEDE